MRISKPFGERTQTLKEIKHKYFLIYEGEDTEKQYFDGIINFAEQLGINSLVEMIPILKSYNEKNWSNPQKILDNLIQYFEKINNNILILEDFVNYTIDWLIEENIIGKKGIYNTNNIFNLCLNAFESDNIHYKKEDLIEIDKACEIIINFLSKIFNLTDTVISINDYIQNQNVVYDPEYDKVCLIVDRDKQSFKDEQYDYVLNTCIKNKYSFYVSNPCFEFWLLLHFDEILNMDRDKLFKNPKETPRAKKRYIEKQLSGLMGGYNKNNLHFDKLINRINSAVKNEKQFCEDIVKLKTELGCNIGKLIEELLS